MDDITVESLASTELDFVIYALGKHFDKVGMWNKTPRPHYRVELLVNAYEKLQADFKIVCEQRDKLLSAAVKTRDLLNEVSNARDSLESAITPVERQGNV